MKVAKVLGLQPPMPEDAFFDGPASEPAPAFPTVGADRIFAPLAPLPYIVPGLHIAPGRPTLVAGYGYSGKTIALQSLALSVATGKPVWGVFSPRRGRTLHLDWEQGARLSFRRYQRLAAAMGVTGAEVGDSLRAAIYPVMRIDDAGAEDVLSRACEGFDLVICDSFTAATGHVEENSSEAGRPLYMLGRVSEKTGATIIVVHHARKPQRDAAGGARMAIRGSGAIFGAADSVFVFAAEKDEPVRVSHERSPSDGQHLADFGLAIEDVEIDGDKRGGLRVAHKDAEQLEPKTSVTTAKLTAVDQKVLAAIKSSPGMGKESVCAAVGMNRSAFYQSVTRLTEQELAEVRTSGRAKTLWPCL
jgi:hypothetical protein